MKQLLINAWYRKAWWLWILWPLSVLYAALSTIHRKVVCRQPRYQPQVPLIVIGNITAGGTGKTPLCLALAKHFGSQGKTVVIVSRGYGGNASHYPLIVTDKSNPTESGDEALLLAQHSGCKVVVDPQRVRAVHYAEQQLDADIILSDDGLQHHAMKGSVELIVIDGKRGLGNGLLLPAGPLREKANRLCHVDAVICNGELQHSLPHQPQQLFTMHMQTTTLRNLHSGKQIGITEWNTQQGQGNTVHAIAGIGNPERFFTSLGELGFAIIPHAFDDHHAYRVSELEYGDELPLIMTSKDAVKCSRFAKTNWWVLEVEAILPTDFLDFINSKMQRQP